MNSEVQWGKPLNIELVGNGGVMQVIVWMSDSSEIGTSRLGGHFPYK